MNGKTLYTLDRLGTLSAGARIEHQTACCSIELQEHVANRFSHKYQGTAIIISSTTISTFLNPKKI